MSQLFRTGIVNQPRQDATFDTTGRQVWPIIPTRKSCDRCLRQTTTRHTNWRQSVLKVETTLSNQLVLLIQFFTPQIKFRMHLNTLHKDTLWKKHVGKIHCGKANCTLSKYSITKIKIAVERIESVI